MRYQQESKSASVQYEGHWSHWSLVIGYRLLVTGHWSVAMIQIYLQITPWKPQDSTRWWQVWSENDVTKQAV